MDQYINLETPGTNQLSQVDKLKQEVEALRRENKRLRAEKKAQETSLEVAGDTDKERLPAPTTRRVRTKRQSEWQQLNHLPVNEEEEEADHSETKRKIICAILTAAVVLVAIHFFGLLGPAFFGLIAGGLLKAK